MKFARLIFPAAILMAGCAPMGPDYKRIDVETPSHFKESGVWKFARPADHLPRGSWWTIFGDSTLNRLQGQAAADNPGLRAAMLRVEQARNIARGSTAQLLPTLSFNPSATREGESENVRRSNDDTRAFEGTRNTFNLPLDAGYEIDFWGKVRRGIEAARADADAAAALGETVRLTLQADLAQTYFTLRSVQAEIEILQGTVELRQKALTLLRNRFEGGATSELDVSRAETELTGSQSELTGMKRRRIELVNAIATLAGRPASSFDLTVKALVGAPPGIPSGIPADLLQRRPDIAEAERRMAAANARIGVAKAAFFPSIRLLGGVGLESSQTKNLFESGSRTWSLGSLINVPIFEQLVNRTNYKGKKLEYEETTANYQSTVLRAFQEVENSLSGLRLLAEQASVQERAVAASQKAARLSTDRYQAGLVSFLEVVDADRTRLQSLQLARQIAGQRYLTAVQLIKAIGGGW
ncbi:MAG TPA: efflux transporter outer membrane subunit [Verrucomicrobiales bacterium]|jgi:multidrug efflux system outer membrane protein|nr:efflux transporter outer membrane subunit [Verrucomicrobiales bacterium]